MFGWRKRIGWISPTVLEVSGYDFYNFAPEGVGLVGVTCNMDTLSEAEFERVTSAVDAAADYLASRRVDFIVHAGGVPVISRGVGYAEELVERIQDRTGIPATTTALSALQALRHLGIHELVLASPYPEHVNQTQATFLEAHGFRVLHSATLNLEFKALQDVSDSTIYRFAVEAAGAAPEADGVYMPGGNVPICDVVEFIEQDLGKPVVASNNANCWAAFRAVGLGDSIRGYGKLLETLASP